WLKLLFTAFDLATACLLLLLLRAAGRPAADVLVYAWHPLVVTETALSGHQDSLGIFFLVASLMLAALPRPAPTAPRTAPADAGRPAVSPLCAVRCALCAASEATMSALSGLALGLSVAAKSFTVFYLPAMARRGRWPLVAAACAVI